MVEERRIAAVAERPLAEQRLYRLEPWLWAALLVLAELLVITDTQLGLWLHGLALFTLLLRSQRERSRGSPLYVTLALVPLVRLVPNTIVLEPYSPPPLVELSLLSLPLLLASVAAARAVNVDLFGRLRPSHLLYLPFVLIASAVVGFAAYRISVPVTAVVEPELELVLIPILVLGLVTLSEELLFRGLLLRVSAKYLGKWHGIWLSSVCYAAMHLVWQSWPLAGLALLAGVIWGWFTIRTGTPLLAVVGHSLASIMVFVVMPHRALFLG